MLRATWLALGCLLLSTFAGCEQTDFYWLRLLPPATISQPNAVSIALAQPYVHREGTPILFDLYRHTDSTQPLPLVIVVHGGFWIGGSRAEIADYAFDIAAQGYAAAAIDYRPIDRETSFPGPVVDILAAIRFFRKNAAEFGIDPGRIALLGKSAGAHLALLAGMAADANIFDSNLPVGEPAGVAAIVNLFGPTDLTADPSSATPWQVALVEAFLGQPIDRDPMLNAAASPTSYARLSGPPVLTIHCAGDGIVPVSQARSLVTALDAAGQRNEYFEIPSAGHLACDTWLSQTAQSYRAILFEFLARNL